MMIKMEIKKSQFTILTEKNFQENKLQMLIIKIKILVFLILGQEIRIQETSIVKA